MRIANKGDISYGFWVGLGVLLAFAAWHLVTRMLSAAAGAADRNG